jgi:hypothetical protein
MSNLPPEPGTVPDLTLGVEGDFDDPPESEPDEPTLVNDDEEEEDG